MSMKTLRMALALAAIPALALAADAEAKKPAAKKAAKPAAAAAVALKGSAASVKILGDSTMHKWEANATALTISGESKDGDLLAGIKANGLSKLELVIGVDGLQSTESKSMDKNMHNAMESDKAAEIKFSLKSYTLEGDNVAAKARAGMAARAKAIRRVFIDMVSS